MAGKREGKSDVMAGPRDVNREPNFVFVLPKVDDTGTITGYYYPAICQVDEDKGTAAIQTCIASAVNLDFDLPIELIESILLALFTPEDQQPPWPPNYPPKT